MIHGLNNKFLYTAKKVIATWANGDTIAETRGTGFFISSSMGIYFFTNRHVVEPGYSDPKYKDFKVMQFCIESYAKFDEKNLPSNINTGNISNWNEFIYDNNRDNDIACLKNPTIIGNDFMVNADIPISMIASEDWIFSNMSVCDTIAYPGFPNRYDHKNNTPIFRMGTIASDPRLNYSADSNMDDAARIAYEGFSSNGASGSPVFAIQKGFPIGEGLSAPDDFYSEVKMIGINGGHFLGDEGHSGISFFYKSSVILDMIEKLDIIPSENATELEGSVNE